MRKLRDHQIKSDRVRLIEEEIQEARGTYDRLKKYIDTRGYIDFKLNDAVWTGSVIYVPINGGTAFVMGNTVQRTGTIDCYISNAQPNKTYYFFLKKDNTISYRTTPDEREDDMILGSVSTLGEVSNLITKDLRRIIRKDGIYDEVVAARGPYDKIKEYIDSKEYLDFALGVPEFDGTTIKVPIYGGQAWVLDNFIEKENQVYTLLQPLPNTTYYFFLNQYGSIVHDTTPTESKNRMILGSVVIGSSLDQLTIKDMRKILNKDGIQEEVIEARGEYATLNERLDAEFVITTDIGKHRAAIVCIKDYLLPGVRNLIQALIPESLIIDKIILHADEAPRGGGLILDINKNGTSIFTNQDKRPQILEGQNDTIAMDFDINNFTEGDILSIDVDEAGLIEPGGRDLLLTVKFSLAIQI